ncbi:MAG TPA: hypothetical protein PKL48_00560 [Thermodesulfobacteriota bacterium]|nr:hypothetical protein [Deltaproteobacteria bacterium]HNU70187.1 hypothetical protein [Thermodesulfobacteriota bacterium]
MDSFTELEQRFYPLLRKAYQGRKPVPVGEEWKRSVLRHIRSLEPFSGQPSLWELFGNVVWRFAPVTCALILMVCVGTASIDFVPEYEMAKVYLDNPVEFSLLRSLGI